MSAIHSAKLRFLLEGSQKRRENDMNGKKRIQAAFEGRSMDRVPVYQLSASCGVASELLGRDAYVGFGIQQWREAAALWEGPDAHEEFLERTYQDTLAINRYYGNDLYRFVYPRAPGKPTRKIDEHTYVYENGPEENWRVLRFDPSQEHIDVLLRLQAETQADLRIDGTIAGGQRTGVCGIAAGAAAPARRRPVAAGAGR
jgi:hypothetical protein